MVDILRLSLCTLGLERRREGEINQFTKNFTDLPGSTVVKNLPSNAGDLGSIPDWGTKIPHAEGQLNQSACLLQQKSRMPQLRPNTAN